jgi:hypothetical protein
MVERACRRRQFFRPLSLNQALPASLSSALRERLPARPPLVLRAHTQAASGPHGIGARFASRHSPRDIFTLVTLAARKG